MPPALVRFVRVVEAVNHRIGRIAMYLLFAIMAMLLYSSATKVIHLPALWTLEMAQFTLVAYYLLGAPYSLQLGSHVRMDLLYARLAPRRQLWWDVFTVLALMFYLGVMVWGGIESTHYSLATGERAPSAWRPYLWPIKVVITASFVLMLLQALCFLIRDIAALRGSPIPARRLP